ncbi:hypothetical protein [Spirosoma spitsbergense]|uniref:hypothetical protein n=1 Tax=Spirosoma spitsbergense TaxID=431554 RepID=UPI001FE11129|nr:hypothetical protein [Spirosoma spitsbergense]
MALLNCLSTSYKVVLLLFALYFISDTYSLWLVMARVSTYPIQNLQPLFEIGIITAVYLNSFRKNETGKWIKLAAILSAFIIVFSYRQSTISTVGLTTQRLFETITVLLYFNKILIEARVKNILFHSMFWLSSGLLIYSAGTFFFSLFSSYLYSDTISNEEFDPFWRLNQILYIIFCLMSSVGIWVCRYEIDNLS